MVSVVTVESSMWLLVSMTFSSTLESSMGPISTVEEIGCILSTTSISVVLVRVVHSRFVGDFRFFDKVVHSKTDGTAPLTSTLFPVSVFFISVGLK